MRSRILLLTTLAGLAGCSGGDYGGGYGGYPSYGGGYGYRPYGGTEVTGATGITPTAIDSSTTNLRRLSACSSHRLRRRPVRRHPRRRRGSGYWISLASVISIAVGRA